MKFSLCLDPLALKDSQSVKTTLIQLVTAGPSKELASLQLPSAPGGPLQTISVKTEKLRTIDDTITTKVGDTIMKDFQNKVYWPFLYHQLKVFFHKLS